MLSIVLSVCMLLLSPVGAQRAEAFPGVSSIAMGTTAGGAAGLAAGALVGALGLGTAAVGLPALGLLGAAVGGIATVMLGNTGMDTGQAIGMGAAGAAVGAGALAAGGFLFSPWILIPAAAIGIGALAWKYADRPNQWGGPGDARYTGGFRDPFFSTQSRLANTSQTGAGDATVLSKIRSIFDRNRRDDNFLAGSRVNPDGTLRSRNDLFARTSLWLNGSRSTGAYGGGPNFHGPGYGNAGYFAPGAMPQTDRLGQIRVGGANTSSFRSAYSLNAPGSPVSAEVVELAAAKDEAYRDLMEAMKSGGDTAAPMAAYQQAVEALQAASK
jgi:hypothetical protein